MAKYIFIISLFLFLVGCSSFYDDYSKNEWQALSREKQDVVKKEYLEIVKNKNEIVHGDPVEQATDSFKVRNISRSYQQNP